MIAFAMFLFGLVLGGMFMYVTQDVPLLPHRDEQ